MDPSRTCKQEGTTLACIRLEDPQGDQVGGVARGLGTEADAMSKTKSQSPHIRPVSMMAMPGGPRRSQPVRIPTMRRKNAGNR